MGILKTQKNSRKSTFRQPWRQPATLIIIRLRHKCFPANFVNFVRHLRNTAFVVNSEHMTVSSITMYFQQ